METIYPHGSKIKRVNYSAGTQVLKVVFNKLKGLEQREYSEVPKEVGSKFAYLYAAGDVLSYFALNIRGKYTVTGITAPKF